MQPLAESLRQVADIALSPGLLIVYLFLLPTLYVHFRGRERHSFLRQLTDHSTFMAPYNVLMYLFSKVPRTPTLPVDCFPELERIREQWPVIRDEAARLYQSGHVKAAEGHTDLAFNSFFRRGWKRFYLKWYGDFLPSAEELCPRTVELLKSIPSINAGMFTLLAPHSRLVTHRDPFAGSLRYHLGLMTPNSDDCYIAIDGTPHSWRDGEDLLFDETYVHTAVNDTDVPRVILFCDVDRPLWFAPARWLNRFVVHHVAKATATRNEQGEEVGVFNRAFSHVYKLRLVAKRVKAWNRKVYYALKLVLLGGLVVGLIWLLA